MLTHRVTLPSGVVIDFFDNQVEEQFFDFFGLPYKKMKNPQAKKCDLQAVKKARKNAKLARRKNR